MKVRGVLAVLGILLAVVIGLVLGRNVIAKRVLLSGVERASGFPLEINSLDLSASGRSFEARGIRLLNPPEFPDPVFVDFDRLYAHYDVVSLWRREPHLYEVGIKIDEVVIVRNENGEVNARKLKGVGAEDDRQAPYRIDTLHLQIGTVTYRDYTGGEMIERVMPLDFKATYYDLDDATDISRLVLLSVMRQVSLPEIGLKLEELTQDLGPVRDAAGELMQSEIVEKARERLQQRLRELWPRTNPPAQGPSI
jgi:uncharacterized protein involved in outer membrane biogenesis